jgi:WD40 repeat protein/HEAT repeat protein
MTTTNPVTAEAPATFPEGPGSDRFQSLAQMREEHGKLLHLFRQEKKSPTSRQKAQEFLSRGKATGVLLTNDNDRSSAQGFLDYWATTLYRDYGESAEVTLEEAHPEFEPELADDQCPYLGPRSFQEDQSKLLYGREKIIEQCLHNLEEHHLVVLVGAPGSGRTSLVKAGIVPALKAGALPGSQDWRYPSPLLFEGNFAVALANAFPAPQKPQPLLEKLTGSLKHDHPEDHVRQDPNFLATLVDSGGEQPAVVVLDQFEYLFTTSSSQDRQAVAANLARLFRRAGRKHYLILIVRPDVERRLPELELFQLEKKLEFPVPDKKNPSPPAPESFTPPPTPDQVCVFIPPFTTEELRRAILEPAALVGLKFDPLVVDQLLLDVQGDPAVLPLLQFNLLRLWDHRTRNKITWESYKKVGGGRQALQDSAEEFYRGLSDKEKRAAKEVLLKLVRPTLGPEQFATHALLRAELAGPRKSRAARLCDKCVSLVKAPAVVKESPEERTVIEKLLATRLVYRVEGRDGPGEKIVLVHEALVNYWPELSRWLEEERDWLRTFWLRAKYTAAVVAACGAIFTAVVLFLLLQWALRAEEDAQKLKKKAEAARGQAQRENAKWTVDQGARLLEAGDIAGASLWFNRALRLDVESGTPNQEDLHRLRVSTAMRQLPHLTQLLHHKGLSQAEYSPDGQYIISAGSDKTVCVWDAKKGEKLNPTWKHEGAVHQMAILKNAKKNLVVVTASGDLPKKEEKEPQNGKLQVWSFAEDTKTTLYQDKDRLPITRVACSPDGLWVAAVVSDPRRVEQGANPRKGLNQWVVVCGADGKKPAVEFKWLSGTVTCVAFSPNSTYLVVTANLPDNRGGVAQGKTRVYKQLDGGGWKDEVNWSLDHRGAVQCAAFSWDSQVVVTAGGRQDPLEGPSPLGGPVGEARLWSAEPKVDTSPTPLGAPLSHKKLVTSVAFSPDGRLFVTTSQDNTAQLWRLYRGSGPKGDPKITVVHFQRPLEHSFWVFSAAFSDDGRFVITSSRDQKARVWDVSSGKQALPSLDHGVAVSAAFFHPDCDRAVTVSEDLVRVWEASAPSVRRTLIGQWLHRHPISANGRFILQENKVGVQVFDLENPRAAPRPIQLRKEEREKWFAFSPTGNRLVGVLPARSPKPGAVQVWDLGAGQQPQARSLTDKEPWAAYTSQAAFSGDGRVVAVTGLVEAAGRVFGQTRVWDAVTGAEVALKEFSPRGETYDLLPALVAVSRDGRFVVAAGATGDGKGAALVWDLSKEVVHPLKWYEGDIRCHKEPILSVALHPNGKWLATGSADDTAQLWDLETGKPLLSEPIRHTSDVAHVAFHPTGDQLVTAGFDRKALVWNVQALAGGRTTVTLRATLEHPERDRTLTCAEFSPWDHSLLLTTSEAGGVHIWNWETQEMVAILPHLGRLQSTLFHPTRKRVVTVTFPELGNPGQVWDWDLTPLDHSLKDLKQYAEMVSAKTLDEDKHVFRPLTLDDLQSRKDSLQKLFPQGFSHREHKVLAEECEAKEQWFAAAWHLQKVIETQPPNTLELVLKQARYKSWWAQETKLETAILLSQPGNPSPAQLEDFYDVLANGPPSARRRAATEIGRSLSRDPKAVAVLIGALETEEDDAVVPQILDALKQAGGLPQGPLAERLLTATARVLSKQELGLKAAGNLVFSQTGVNNPAFVVALFRQEKESPAVRLACLRALTLVGPPRGVVGDIIQVLGDSDKAGMALRIAAARALGNIGLDDQDALKALGRAEQDPDPDVSYAARVALSQLRADPTFEARGALTEADPFDKKRKTMHHTVYTYPVKAGQTITIDLDSKWDNFLRLEDAQGVELAWNDDYGGSTNAHIDFTAKVDGWYRIIVTSYGSGVTGDYTLKVVRKGN